MFAVGETDDRECVLVERADVFERRPFAVRHHSLELVDLGGHRGVEVQRHQQLAVRQGIAHHVDVKPLAVVVPAQPDREARTPGTALLLLAVDIDGHEGRIHLLLHRVETRVEGIRLFALPLLGCNKSRLAQNDRRREGERHGPVLRVEDDHVRGHRRKILADSGIVPELERATLQESRDEQPVLLRMEEELGLFGGDVPARKRKRLHPFDRTFRLEFDSCLFGIPTHGRGLVPTSVELNHDGIHEVRAYGEVLHHHAVRAHHIPGHDERLVVVHVVRQAVVMRPVTVRTHVGDVESRGFVALGRLEAHLHGNGRPRMLLHQGARRGDVARTVRRARDGGCRHQANQYGLYWLFHCRSSFSVSSRYLRINCISRPLRSTVTDILSCAGKPSRAFL